MKPVRIGCSGWVYKDWKSVFYPEKLPQREWLRHYASEFETVEINNTFYRLPSVEAVGRWAEETPDDFLIAIKGSRYLTHMKRLTDLGLGLDRFYERLDPLVAAGRLDPVLWQLPESFHRNDERLAAAIAALSERPGRHCFEFRHASWFVPEVYEQLRAAGMALVIGDHPRWPDQAHELTAGWTYVRLHYGSRGRRGNYSDREIDEWAERISEWREHAEVLVYLNNDWEGFAIHNARRLRAICEAASGQTMTAAR